MKHQTIAQKLFLLKNRILYNFRFHIRGGSRHIIIPEKFRKFIKIIKYILTTISLISAYFIFKTVHEAFLFGLATWLLSHFLEKILFSINTLFIHPLPSFELESERWVATGFGYSNPKQNPEDKIPLVAMIFDNKEYAKKIHELISSWVGKDLKDEKPLVSASVIIMKENHYVFFIYPNIMRDEKLGTYDDLKDKFHDQFPDGVHQKIKLALCLGKKFNITKESFLPSFRKMHQDGVPILLSIRFMKDSSSNSEPIEGCRDLIIFDFKIRDRSQLTKKDPEYSLIKYNEYS